MSRESRARQGRAQPQPSAMFSGTEVAARRSWLTRGSSYPVGPCAAARCSSGSNGQSSLAAQRSLVAACDQHNPLACYVLGLMLQTGVLFEPRPKDAQVRLENACAADLQMACRQVASNLFFEVNAKRDPIRAERLFTKACRSGIKSVCKQLEQAQALTGLSKTVHSQDSARSRSVQ